MIIYGGSFTFLNVASSNGSIFKWKTFTVREWSPGPGFVLTIGIASEYEYLTPRLYTWYSIVVGHNEYSSSQSYICCLRSWVSSCIQIQVSFTNALCEYDTLMVKWSKAVTPEVPCPHLHLATNDQWCQNCPTFPHS